MIRVNTKTVSILPSALTVDVADYESDRTLIHCIRQIVFVYEQHIPEALEADQLDPLSWHVIARWAGFAVGTGRLTPDGCIGRVAVVKPLRRRGVGREIMQQLLTVAEQQCQRQVTLSAQRHAVPFYEKLGFQAEGRPYHEMGIKHIKMRKLIATTPTTQASVVEPKLSQRVEQ